MDRKMKAAIISLLLRTQIAFAKKFTNKYCFRQKMVPAFSVKPFRQTIQKVKTKSISSLLEVLSLMAISVINVSLRDNASYIIYQLYFCPKPFIKITFTKEAAK